MYTKFYNITFLALIFLANCDALRSNKGDFTEGREGEDLIEVTAKNGHSNHDKSF